MNENAPNGDLVDNAAKAVDTAKTAKNIGSAAKKAAVGNYVGAAATLLKDGNFLKSLGHIAKAVIAVILVFSFLIVGVGMLVGAAIWGGVQELANSVVKNWNEAWEQEGIASQGNVLYLYSTGALHAGISAIGDSIVEAIEKVFDATHEILGMDASNDELGGTDIKNEDYTQTISSVSDKDALVGSDGILQRKLDLVKGRLEQRGEQLASEAGGLYSASILGKEISESLAALLDISPQNGTLQLCAGIDWDNSSLDVDTSAFLLNDVQALKILAAYSVQHDCVLANTDMWGIMDYCGWYGRQLSYVPDTSPSLYSAKADGAYTEEIAGLVQAGDSINTSTFHLDPPSVPFWSGKAAPQWYYEEIKQLEKINEDYQMAIDAAQTREELEAAKNGLHFETDAKGQLVLSNFEKLGKTHTFGILDKMFLSSTASVQISRSEYFPVKNASEIVFHELGTNAQKLWNTVVGDKSTTTGKGNTIQRNEDGSHSFILNNTNAACSYFLQNDTTGLATDVRQGGEPIVWNGLAANTHYSVFCRFRNSVKRIDNDSHIHETDFGDDSGSAKPVIPPVSLPDMVIDEFTTLSKADKVEAYKLQCNSKVRFAERDLEDLLFNELGLWCGSLEDTTVLNGVEYAAGFEGNENLRKTWTDVYTDPVTGEKTTITFERLQGNQNQAFWDSVIGIATELGYDLAGLATPDYGYGSTIVNMATEELKYYAEHDLSGGERYWTIASDALFGTPDGFTYNNPWSAAFVNACAYQCGFIGFGGWYGNEQWEMTPGGLYQSITGSGKGIGHDAPDKYRPVPGDLLFTGDSIGCQEPKTVGIVEYVGEDNTIHTIEGDIGGKVARVTYSNFIIGTAAGEDSVISHYIHPDYPSTFLSHPLYTTIDTQYKPTTAARYLDDTFVLSGLPRFRQEQMGEVLDELATLYPELYTEKLKKNYPFQLGSCRVDGYTWLVPIDYDHISSPFGERVHPIYHEIRMHNGIDLSAPEGYPIFAPRDGVVSLAAYNDSCGNYVEIEHDGGYKTTFMHMVKYIVNYGDSVKAGQVIGYCGETGAATGPHLHYEVRHQGVLHDPAKYLGLTSAGSGNADVTDPEPLDMYGLCEAWNDLCVRGKEGRFTTAQYDIAGKLYVLPAAAEITVNTGFNWNATPERKEILWGLATTTSNHDALVKTLAQISTSVSKHCTAAELINALTQDDKMLTIITANADQLWKGETEESQSIWIDSIRLLLEAVTDKYVNAPL